jgi:hypothetical protein
LETTFSDLVWIFFRLDVDIMRIESSISASSVVKTMLKKLGSEEAIDKMHIDVVDFLVLNVGHVEDDKDPCSGSVLQIMKLETAIRNASRRQQLAEFQAPSSKILKLAIGISLHVQTPGCLSIR